MGKPSPLKPPSPDHPGFEGNYEGAIIAEIASKVYERFLRSSSPAVRCVADDCYGEACRGVMEEIERFRRQCNGYLPPLEPHMGILYREAYRRANRFIARIVRWQRDIKDDGKPVGVPDYEDVLDYDGQVRDDDDSLINFTTPPLVASARVDPDAPLGLAGGSFQKLHDAVRDAVSEKEYEALMDRAGIWKGALFGKEGGKALQKTVMAARQKMRQNRAVLAAVKEIDECL